MAQGHRSGPSPRLTRGQGSGGQAPGSSLLSWEPRAEAMTSPRGEGSRVPEEPGGGPGQGPHLRAAYGGPTRAGRSCPAHVLTPLHSRTSERLLDTLLAHPPPPTNSCRKLILSLRCHTYTSNLFPETFTFCLYGTPCGFFRHLAGARQRGSPPQPTRPPAPRVSVLAAECLRTAPQPTAHAAPAHPPPGLRTASAFAAFLSGVL